MMVFQGEAENGEVDHMTVTSWEIKRMKMIRKIFVLFFCIAMMIVFPGSLWNAEAAEERSPRIVIIELHGMKEGIINEKFENLPHFREMLMGGNDDQSYIYFPRVFVTMPAASVPGISSMYTGFYPKHTGIVSTIWFDRKSHEVRTMISYGQQRINTILKEKGVTTLFDLVGAAGKRSMTAMLMVTNGVDWPIRSGAFFWGNASVLGLIEKGFWIPSSRYIDERTVMAFEDGHLFNFCKSLRGIAKYGWEIPHVMVIQLLGTDLYSHYPPSELICAHATMNGIQRQYAEAVLDPLMVHIMETLKDVGCYEDTVFILVSEHGFTKIESFLSNNLVDDSLQGAFRLPGGGIGCGDADAVIMPGASTKEIYLKNRETGIWLDPPRLLRDVKPAVDLLLQNDEISEHMNALVIRQYPGERNEGVVEDDCWWCFDCDGYDSDTGDDGFLKALKPMAKLSCRFELKDYVVDGLRNQYTRTTAPDIKIINKRGSYFENDRRKYGHHGSYYRSDSVVSFWVGGPGLKGVFPGRHIVRQNVSTRDLVPLVLFMLGIPVPDGLDGINPLQYLIEGRTDGPMPHR